MAVQWITAAGLVSGMVGVIILYILGTSKPLLLEHETLGLGTKVELTQSTLTRRHKIMSKVGFALVGISFLSQTAPVWVAHLFP